MSTSTSRIVWYSPLTGKNAFEIQPNPNVSDTALSEIYLKADGTRQVSGATWDMGAPDLTTTGFVHASSFKGNTGSHTYLDAYENKDIRLTTSGTGNVLLNSVPLVTTTGTQTLTNKTLASSTNFIRPTYSYRRVDNTLGATLNQNINTTIVFDTIMSDVGVFSSEMTITAHKFINSSGALRSWTVLFTFFTSGIVSGAIEQYDVSNTLVNSWIGTLSPVINSNGQTNAEALMDIGDYLVFKIFTTSAGPYLYASGTAVRTNVTFIDHGLH